jgi:hypothetical protein
MANVYYGDPDLIWIQEAVEEYGRARGTLDSLVDRGLLHPVEFAGDKRRYLRRSELNHVLGKPIRDVPRQDNNAS